MTDHVAGLITPASSPSANLTTLHRLCRDEYRGGAARRSLDHLDAGVRVVADDTPQPEPVEPGDLAVAIRLAQLTLASTATADHGDAETLGQAHGSLRESLRILLRALNAETAVQR